MAGFLDFIYSYRTMQQFLALYRKNALVAWRNWRATVLRLCASFIFLLLALIIDKALQQSNRKASDNINDTNPSPTAVTAIPSCHSDMYINNHACIELIYSPNNTVTQQIMRQVVDNNPIPISASAFANDITANKFLYDNPDYVIGAVQFIFSNLSNITASALQGFVLQTNSTVKQFKGMYQNPNTFVQMPLQVAVQREIARYQMNQLGMSSVADQLAFDVGLETFAHPVIDTTSALSYVLGPFIFAACMFSFVMQMAAMVMEKEAGLKQALRTMGMTDTAYWMSWQAWEITLSFVSANLIALFGMLLQFRIFLVNNYGLLFFLFFLFYIAMSSLAMLLTTFFSKAQSAVYMGFVMFLIGWIMQVVVIFGVPYVPDYYNKWGGALTVIFSIFPWDLLTKGFLDLGSATVGSNPGIRWSERYSYCKNIPVVSQQPAYDPNQVYIDYECVMPLGLVYIVLVILWIGFFVLAVYFDNIIKNEHGVSRAPWYFLMPSYWFPRPAAAGAFLQRVLTPNKESPPPEGEMDDDVLAEQKRMQALLNHRTGAPGAMAEEVAAPNAVEVYGLQKMYRGGRGCCGGSIRCCEACDCCSFVKSDHFWSIKGSWFAIEQNSLFCLLGPNGAGKTTTINCLTGVIPASHGEALVYGEAIGSPGGLDRIRSVMGVCPQFDVLWGELNGHEHLNLYGAVKGLPWRGLSDEASLLLEKVKLTPAGRQRTSAYSGGMKRRLSVAIALLGDPKVVYLDEPTTGMDPISRRYVWDIIQEAKVGRAIVLTTHSMEEADILGDRIAIMARGRLRCLGTSIRLKQRFGAGYQIALSVMSPNLDDEQDVEARAARTERVRQYVRERLSLEPVEESKAYLSYVIHRSREAELVRFLAALESDRQSLGLTDVQLSLTSLEEVFLNIARKAEIEVAQALGDTETEVILDDGTPLAVPIGAEMVQHPETNVVYKVRWGQDDQGHLVVLSTTAVQNVPAVPPVTFPPKQQSIMESSTLRSNSAGRPGSSGSGGNRPGSSGGSYRGGSAVHPAPPSPSPRVPPQPGTPPGFIGMEDPHARTSSASGGWQSVRQ